MALTYELISSSTLTSTQTSVTFSSIPATYTDLRLVVTATGSGNFEARVNNSTSAIYNFTYFAGGGATVDSGISTNADRWYITAYGMGLSSTIPQMYTLDIFSYLNDSVYKTALSMSSEDQNTNGGYVVRQANLWKSTAAITSVTAQATSLLSGSVISLYGIARA